MKLDISSTSAILWLIIGCGLLGCNPASCHESAIPMKGGIELDYRGANSAEHLEYEFMQRHLLQDTAIASGNGRPPAWKARFDPKYGDSYVAPARIKNSCDDRKKNCTAISGKRYPYDEYILDPTTSGDKQPVMRVWYPAKSWSPGSERPGGMLMFVYPYKSHPTMDYNNPTSGVSAALEYEVYIPHDFDFVKGGKLMGLSGGSNNGRGCGGGADPAWCFNARIMWRRSGWGEAYLYVPEGMQHDEFCSKFPECSGERIQPCNFCNFKKGVSYARGGFVFNRGEWNKIYLNVTLNTPNITNGILEIRHNGRRAIYNDKINWRQKSDAKIEAVEFSTWYGGSDTSWGPPRDTHILLRNIKIWRGDLPSAPSVVPSSPRPPVVVEEELHETKWAGPANFTDPGSEVLKAFTGGSVESLVEYVKTRNLLLARGGQVEEMPAWRGRFNPKFGKSYLAPAMTANICQDGKQCRSNIGSYPYDEYLKDPTGESEEPVLKIGYPKGSWSPGSPKPGGILFFAYPYKEDTFTKDNPFSAESATLEYDVYFPSDFDFVKGGKLPGLAGGRSNGRGCGGGNSGESCFSVRIMWRRQGQGELYIYGPSKQSKEICTKFPPCGKTNGPCTICNSRAGISFGRGTFNFKRGAWQRISVTVVLNDPNKSNGYVELKVDGRTKASFDKMNWRKDQKVKIEALTFASWFGGSDSSWAPPKDTFALLKNMKAYRTGPATLTSRAEGRVVPMDIGGPVESTIVYEEIEEPEEFEDYE